MQYNAIFLTLGLLPPFLVAPVTGYRILGLFPVPIRSNYQFYETLLLELVKRGHEVDVITHFPRGASLRNYNELSIAGSMTSLENNISISDYGTKTVLHYASEFAKLGNEVCLSSLQHPIIQQLKTLNKKYDLVLTEMFITDCLLPYAHIYNAPVVGISSIGIMPWVDERMGNPDNPAYVPNYFLPLRGKLSFIEKCYMTVMNIGIKAWYYVMLTVPAEIRGRKVFGNTPSIENIAKNTLLVLANRHFSLDDPRPLVPGVIEIGGMHIGTPMKIQPKLSIVAFWKALDDFINSSPDGVVYFSMGTLINMKTFSSTHLTSILKILSSLKQSIILKLPQDLIHSLSLSPSLLSTIYISDNLPQLDILCHLKTNLFITHGGLLSIQEAAHCGVPIIGLPFYPHQEVNIKNYVNKQAGIHLDYASFDESTFTAAVEDVLTNKAYKENAMKLSVVFNDRPMSPLETSVYWIEYAMKHGGKHLRSLSADLIAFEYLLIDIVLLGVALVMIQVYLLYLVLQYLQDLFDKPPPPKYEEKKKN